VKGKDT